MNWSFKNNPNAEAFRRSMLPFYLLKDDSGWQHPTYIEYSNLSQNLCENTSVKIIIYISKKIQEKIDTAQNYIMQDKRNMHQTAGQRGFNRYRKQTMAQKVSKNDENIVIENFYLLKTAQSLIDQAVEEMYKKYYSDLFESKE